MVAKFAIGMVLALGFLGSAEANQAAQSKPGFVPAAAPAPSAPAKVCFRDVREFEALRTRLPVQLQSGSVYAVHKSLFMKGGFRVIQVGARFVIEGKGKALIGRLNESQNIKIACVEGKKLSVWLDDGRYDEIGLEPNGFRFHDYLFKTTTAEGYDRMVRSL